jgi:pSer/pThr/pTyr-binding forkhead associated (FHA) protein
LNKKGNTRCRQCGNVMHKSPPPLPDSDLATAARVNLPENLQSIVEPMHRPIGWAGSVQPHLRSWSSRPQIAADGTVRFGAKLSKPLSVLVFFGRTGLPAECRLLQTPVTTFGREQGDVLIINDPAVSARHAQLRYRDDMTLVLSDLGSTNGTFYRLRAGQSYRLWDGCRVVIGQQTFRFRQVIGTPSAPEEPRKRTMALSSAPPATVHGYLISETDGEELPLGERTTVGRKPGEAELAFPGDPFLSPAHAAFEYLLRFQQIAVQDLRSFNGTFVQVQKEIVLEDGDQFRVGEQLFGIVQAD